MRPFNSSQNWPDVLTFGLRTALDPSITSKPSKGSEDNTNYTYKENARSNQCVYVRTLVAGTSLMTKTDVRAEVSQKNPRCDDGRTSFRDAGCW